MGNKIDPRLFRLGVNKNWDSIWYAEKGEYVRLSYEDRKVRAMIDKKLQNAGVEKVIIKRSLNRIAVEIIVARPGVVIGRGGAGIEELKRELGKLLGSDVDLKIQEVKDPDVSAVLIAQNIRAQVIRRIAPKFVMSKEIEKAKSSNANIKGIRIWVSGRIRGVENARIEKAQWGMVPLATLRADIDYAMLDAQVPNAGKHGIKVWVYKGEKPNIDYDHS